MNNVGNKTATFGETYEEIIKLNSGNFSQLVTGNFILRLLLFWNRSRTVNVPGGKVLPDC